MVPRGLGFCVPSSIQLSICTDSRLFSYWKESKSGCRHSITLGWGYRPGFPSCLCHGWSSASEQHAGQSALLGYSQECVPSAHNILLSALRAKEVLYSDVVDYFGKIFLKLWAYTLGKFCRRTYSSSQVDFGHPPPPGYGLQPKPNDFRRIYFSVGLISLVGLIAFSLNRYYLPCL